MTPHLDTRSSILAVGIWLGQVTQLSGRWHVWLTWSVASVALMLWLFRDRRGVMLGLVIALSVLAGVVTAQATQARRAIPDSSLNTTEQLYLVVDRSVRPTASGRWSFGATVIRIADQPVSGVGIVVSSAPPQLAIGSVMQTRGIVRPGRTPLTYFVEVRGPPVVTAPEGLQARAATLRSGLLRLLSDRQGGPLVAGLTVGDESMQDSSVAERMQRSGLAHLTAVSGGNIAILLLLTFGVARFFTARVGLQVLAGGTAVLAYAYVVGPQPSLLRASLMGAVLLLSLVRGGPATGLPALGTAATVLLLVDATLAVSLGFLLSVVATAGLVLFTAVLTKWLGRVPILCLLPRTALQAMAVAPIAYLATLPVLATAGLTTSWAAVPANILAAPAVPVVTISGVLATVVLTVSEPLAEWVVAPGLLGGRWIEAVANRFGG